MSERRVPARVTAILNPETGRHRAEQLESLLRNILGRQFEVAVLRSTYPGEATALARDAAPNSSIVIAVGGDGTVAEVAAGIIDTPASLAIVPTGTANVIARGLGLPINPARAARLLLRPTTRRYLDIAISGDRVALHMAGAGFDAQMVRDARRELKRVAAWLAYLPPALKHAFGPGWDFTITVDGEVIRTHARMVLVANDPVVLNPRLRIGVGVEPDDGLLDVCIFQPPNARAVLSLSLWTLLGRVNRSRHFRQLKGRDVRLDATPPAPVELDGDDAGTTPLHLRVRPGAIPIVVPARKRGNQRATKRSSSDCPSSEVDAHAVEPSSGRPHCLG